MVFELVEAVVVVGAQATESSELPLVGSSRTTERPHCML